MTQLPGYECDINNLIDTFAIQAHQQQELSFQSFKQLFSSGCYAYIHQAYWGCEHSPEYAQLLFAVALDRLDVPSPTAPPESSLWQLHQLVPRGGLLAAPPDSAHSMQADPTEQQHLEAAAGGPDGPTGTGPPGGDSAAAMDVDQPGLLLPGHDSLALPTGQPADMQLAEHQKQQQQQAQQSGVAGTDQLSTQQQQQQAQQLQQENQPPLQLPSLDELCQPCCSPQPAPQVSPPPPPPQQQQQQQVLGQPFGEDLLSSPLLLPHQTPLQLGQPGTDLSPSDPLYQLLVSPQQQQQQDAGAAARSEPGLEGFMLPAAALPPAGQSQQQEHAMQQQQQQQPQGLLLQQEDEDAFLSDLLAILDEAMQGQEQQQDAAPAAPAAADSAAAAAAAGDNAAAAGPTAPSAASQQQYTLQIPLVVKGAAVFTLLALHESQLNYPKVPVYVPLPLLQQLVVAAAGFRAAGAAAADALQALQVLVQQQRLLVGQFRRPNNWEPQLPAYLMPGGRPPGGLGLNTAIGMAARKAARTAAQSAMQSAAVAAATRAARGAARFDPGVQREAMFHIKSALRTLSNFRSLQSLCDEYAGARSAVFEPLVGTSLQRPLQQPQHTTAAAGPQGQQQQQAQLEGDAGRQQAGQGAAALVVQRGGSRRKRKAAIAANAAAAAATRPSRQHSAAAEAAGTDANAAGMQPLAGQPSAAQAGAAAASSAPPAGVDLPELFDTSFATTLQGLANSEASRMLLRLDPYYSASQVRKRTNEEKRAAKAAEEAAAAAAKGRLSRFQRLTMARVEAGGSSQPATAGGLQQPRQRQQQPSRSAPAATGAQEFQRQLVEAGVFTEEDLQDASASLAGLDNSSKGAAQQALRRAAQQHQTAVQVAQEWLRAQSALVVVDAEDEDGDEDMP